MTYVLAPLGVGFFSKPGSNVYTMAISGMRWYGLGFLFSGLNIFCAVRFMAYGRGHLSGIITFLRSFAFLILFLNYSASLLGAERSLAFGSFCGGPDAACFHRRHYVRSPQRMEASFAST